MPFSMAAMLAAHPADGAAARAHDHALGRHAATLQVLDAPQQRTVGHPRRREDAVALGEVPQLVDAVEVPVLDPPLARAGLLILVTEDQTAVELAAYAAEGGRREHAF